MASIETVIRLFGPGLARVAASYEADRGLRDDLMQEILIAVHAALPNLRGESKLAAFVFRIAHNRGVTHAVKERRARQLRETADRPEAVATPEDVAMERQEARTLLAAVRRLPLPYRQVITLALEGLSHAEIAEALALSVANVAVRINRAKTQLQEMLDA